jgi:lysophospholipase L1-like esterase
MSPSRFLPLVAALLLWGSPALAQNRWVQHYHDRVATFRAQNGRLPADRQHVVLVGDSLTEGWRWGQRVERYLPTLAERVLNRGISSDTAGGARGVLNRMGPSIFDTNPSHVFLMIGVNQIGSAGNGIPRTVQHVEQILDQVEQRLPDVVVVVVTTSPTRGAQRAGLGDAIRRYNERLREVARERGLPLLDFHPLAVGPDGQFPADWTGDGLHFNDHGYEVLGREIERVVAETSGGAAPAPDPTPEPDSDADSGSGSDSDSDSDSDSGSPRSHVVERGETLGRIAQRYGTTTRALAELNGISNPNLIRVGQRLQLPARTPARGIVDRLR